MEWSIHFGQVTAVVRRMTIRWRSGSASRVALCIKEPSSHYRGSE
jgi:hypothetical protein